VILYFYFASVWKIWSVNVVDYAAFLLLRRPHWVPGS